MNSRRAFHGSLIAALVILGVNFGMDRTVAATQDQTSSDEGVQVLTRGLVHEAFAETVTFDPQPGIVVPKAPPQAIEELPPDQRPVGTHVAWIPGYWAWEDERDDFLWVSGIWRALPPGRQWVPGYWGRSGEDSQWTSGYWADAKLSEVQFLPEPPATAEVGPNIAAPSADHVWLPGSWVWNQNRYAWRPGYWTTAQQNWVWVPAHYLWSPSGYVFVNGYYDYSVDSRGVLFAPVYFESSIYARSGFTFTPAMAINLAVFGNQLFLRPNYNHYYFGDYYAPSYSTAGYYPWFSFSSGGYGYDPFYAQQLWQNHQNATWAQTVQGDFQHRVDNEGARPPRTLLAQQALLKSGDNASEKSLLAVTSLALLAKSNGNSLRFQPVPIEEQQKLAKHALEVRQFGEARQVLEAKAAASAAEKPGSEPAPTKIKLPSSPILAKSTEQPDKDHTPPKPHDTLPPDPKVEPKPRQAVAKGDIPKLEPKVTKAEPKPVPKVDPKPTPKVEPKPVPKVEPKPTPKVEPKPTPKVEPKPTPKVEPKGEAPKVEPKGEAPKVDPKKDQPRSEGKEKPKK